MKVLCALFIGGLMNYLMANELNEFYTKINELVEKNEFSSNEVSFLKEQKHRIERLGLSLNYPAWEKKESLLEKICYVRCLLYLNSVIKNLEEGYRICIDFYRFFVEEKKTTSVVSWTNLEEQFCQKLRKEGKNPETIKEDYLAYLARDPQDEEYDYDEDCE